MSVSEIRLPKRRLREAAPLSRVATACAAMAHHANVNAAPDHPEPPS
ncbi:hypothetical protein [Roseobacter weihaiensis]|nr:hypothetical protein [Roseobacter sp. H9]